MVKCPTCKQTTKAKITPEQIMAARAATRAYVANKGKKRHIGKHFKSKRGYDTAAMFPNYIPTQGLVSVIDHEGKKRQMKSRDAAKAVSMGIVPKQFLMADGIAYDPRTRKWAFNATRPKKLGKTITWRDLIK